MRRCELNSLIFGCRKKFIKTSSMNTVYTWIISLLKNHEKDAAKQLTASLSNQLTRKVVFTSVCATAVIPIGMTGNIPFVSVNPVGGHIMLRLRQ